MSGQFDIKEFNDAWRNGRLKLPLRRWFQILTWPFRHPHRAVKAAEPWGILFAVMAFSYEIYQRGEDRADRQRDLIDRSWTRIHAAYPENGTSAGLRDAVETLVSLDNSLAEVKLPKADLERADLIGANLRGADLEGADLFGVDLEGANLKGANLERADLKGANLERVDFSEADLSEADLFGASLTAANLRAADLASTDLTVANLSQANLIGANLSEANLFDAGLSKANLGGADLSGTNLSRARGLTQEQLDNACGNESTKLSRGFTIQMCSEFVWYKLFHGDR